MKSVKRLWTLWPLLGFTIVWAMPLEDLEVKRASHPPIGETIQQLTNQLISLNSTMPNASVTFDTRTPPRVKQQMKNHQKLQPVIENSHPGIAIPADDDEFITEEHNEKITIYKLQTKPTTERGLSTWVLLNSHTVSPSTSKPTIKQIINLTTKINEENNTASTTESSYKPIKPFFKKRPTTTTTTKKPSTTTKMILPVTKVKFSVLQNSRNNSLSTMATTTKTNEVLTTLLATTTTPPNTRATMVSVKNVSKSTPPPKQTTSPKSTTSMKLTLPSKSTTPLKSTNPTRTTSSTKSVMSTKQSALTKSTASIKSTVSSSTTMLPAELKDGEIDLSTTTETQKKNRKTPSKKKKNKNRRRRPSTEKNSTDVTEAVDKISSTTNKPIGSQIYSYLSREIMPTVGVGLLGLMVTAGLASYFLHPFGTLRRSYDTIDRKDVKGSYYYEDEYSPGGMAEEEMISKVLAGMPENQGLDTSAEKDNYFNSRNRKIEKSDKTTSRPQIERYSNYRDTINAYVPQNSYNQYDFVSNSQPHVSEVSNSLYNNKQFVVGSITKKILEVTPAAVPEHGPRKFIRRKRSDNDIENEIQNFETNEILPVQKLPDDSSSPLSTTTRNVDIISSTISDNFDSISNTASLPPCASSTPNTEILKPPNGSTIMQALKDLIELKISLGLEFMKNTTMKLSRYFHEAQKKFENRRRRH